NPATNNFQILVEHLYGDGTFLEQIMGNLRTAYEPEGIAVIHAEKKEGANIQFLSSGNSPVSYSDAFGGNQNYRGRTF
ncbi:MAG: hypothetical protein WC759_05935, partial [Candidatus Micrarchaeia archaeon]